MAAPCTRRGEHVAARLTARGLIAAGICLGLGSIALFVVRHAVAGEPFTEEVARRLLPEAGALDNPGALEAIAKHGDDVRLVDLRAAEAFALPYVALLLAREPAPADLDADFRVVAGRPRLDDLVQAMNGGRPLGTGASLQGVSLLRPEYVTGVTVKQDGSNASGEVRFDAPHAYRGHLLFRATLAAGSWHITSFTFPRTGFRIDYAGGAWREAEMPLAGMPLRLPVVSAPARMPTGPTVVTIGISTTDGVTVDGLPVATILDWRDAVAQRSPRSMRDVDGSSLLNAVILADDDVPWPVLQWAMQVCADEHSQIFRIHFAVRHRASGEVGVLTTLLPKDGSLRPTPQDQSPRPAMHLTMLSREGAQPTSPESVYAAVKARVAADPPVVVEIDTPPPHAARVRFGYVMKIFDAVRRAGAVFVNWTGAPTPVPRDELGRRTLRSLIAERVAEPADSPFVKVGGVALGPDAPATPIPDGLAPSAQPRSSDALVAEQQDPPPEEELPPTPEETEQVHQTDVLAKEPEPPKPDAPDAEPTDPTSHGEWVRGRGFQAFPNRREHLLALKTRLKQGDTQPSDAVADALTWLAVHQSADGGWECAGFPAWCDGKPSTRADRPDGGGKAAYDVGVTGLALLAFLGEGYTNRSDGPFGKTVANGLRYLRNQQDAEGCFGSRATGHFTYNHAIAALAMVEAFGMTGSTNYKQPAQQALDFISALRNPSGAWRYGIRPGDNDTSVTAWMVATLHSARRINRAHVREAKPPPLRVDEEAEQAFVAVRAWLDKVTDPETGRVGYQQRGAGPARQTEIVDQFPAEKSESMTAAGVLTRMFIGENPRSSIAIQKGVALCAALPPTWNPSDGSIDMDYWYFGTLALFQAGGDAWKTWEATLVPAIRDRQRKDTDACAFRGSWDPVDPWSKDGGRVYATAMMAMCLEAAYRYERLFPAPATGK